MPAVPAAPAAPAAPASPSSPNRVVVVAGQRYEVKVVNGKRLMEPIASPVPPVRSVRRKVQPAGIVINPQQAEADVADQEDLAPEAIPVESVQPAMQPAIPTPEAMPAAMPATTPAVMPEAMPEAMPATTPATKPVRTLAMEHVVLPVREGRGGEE